ncbi:MAG: hypothetical protein HY302_01140 [Opitutae bacterium]|nr:hypothetical protein [Opitutae bacterium]
MSCALSGLAPSKTTPKSGAWLVAFLLLVGRLAATADDPPAPPRFAGPFDAGLMAEPRKREASGLAASHRPDGVVWTHHDSGGDPVLFALNSADGSSRGAVRLLGGANTDWEDMASFVLEGRPWLLAADVGDNAAVRRDLALHLVREPDPATLAPGRETALRPDYSIHFRYEDGPRDCEAVAVDPVERAVYLLSKRDGPPRLYRLPLAAAGAAQPAVARIVGTVTHLPEPNFLQRQISAPTGKFRRLPCALDFSPDGRLAVVLTYGDVLLFPRAAGESWAAALAKEPVRLAGHRLPQAEGACFSRDGRSIFVCSEKTMKLLRYDRRASRAGSGAANHE